MKKYSRTTLAHAYVRLAEKYSSEVLATGFAKLFSETHTTRNVGAFSEEVARISAEKHDTVLATVISARALSKASQEKISSYITNKEQRKHANISYVLDPALVGGAIIETPTHTYNFSVQGKINSIL